MKHEHSWVSTSPSAILGAVYDCAKKRCRMSMAKRCDGSEILWKRKMVRRYEDCSECGHKTGWHWTDTASPLFDWHARERKTHSVGGRDYYRCDSCGEVWVVTLGYDDIGLSFVGMGANAILKGIG